jgi:LuxR family transcriptional regulator/LuxR family quorum-sensing system transcriptional regulator CciR
MGMDLDEFESRMSRIDTLDRGDLARLALEFLHGRNIRQVAYHHLPPLGAPDARTARVLSDGFSPEIMEMYAVGRSKGTTPVLNYVQQNPEPVYWDEIESRRVLTPCEKAYVSILREAGAVYGLSMQVFGPHGRNAIFSLGLEPGRTRLDVETLRAVQTACQSVHQRYCALLLPTLGETPELSPREAEVLAWIAQGKSNATVGEILGISAHTVDAHLRRIYLKLGVFDRVSAALRGLGFGLIQPTA